MFPSADRGISILPQLSAAKSLGENEKDTLLHYYEDLLFHSLVEAPIISPEVYPSSGDHNRPLHKHTRPAQSEKKDRHRKIVTAQGPRDRRVRLSKEIARKFFDLQDLLGFDRASKTLDWLLTKSRTAIKEVTQMKLHMDIGPSAQRSSLRSSSECDDGNLDYLKKKSMCTADPKKKQMQNPTKRKAVAKELRAKARARARERTKEKKFLREVTDDEDKKKLPYNSDPIIPINQAIRTWSQIESSDSNSHKSISTGMNGFLCLQPNLVISRESSSNFSHWSPNATENWDISSTVTSSNLCALSNMSSKTVLEISRKPFNFEEYSNNNNNESLMW